MEKLKYCLAVALLLLLGIVPLTAVVYAAIVGFPQVLLALGGSLLLCLLTAWACETVMRYQELKK